jgi:hypothetical protein
MVELIQKRIWDKREFRLLETGIHVRSRTPTEDIEANVRYEELGFDRMYVRKKDASLFFALLIVLTSIAGSMILRKADLTDRMDIVIVTAFALFLFVVLFLAWSETRKPLLVIGGGEKTISLLANSPNRETVDAFVNALYRKIRDRLIQLRVRPLDPEFSLEYKKSMLESMLQEGVISDLEYQETLTLIKTFKSTDPSIGFGYGRHGVEESKGR